MGLHKDDSIYVNEQTHNELSATLGPNFDLYKSASGMKQSVPRASAVRATSTQKPFKYKAAFPPLLTSFTLRQSKQAAPKNIKPIRTTPALLDELSKTLGANNVKMLQQDIGFVEKPAHEVAVIEEKPPQVFGTVWGSSSRRPNYEFSKKPHGSKINGKFYWPNQTNPEAKIPCKVSLPGEVRDLKSWLATYGEPSPDRIPTGFLTTFRKSTRRVGKDKSMGTSMIRKATGEEWKNQLESTRKTAALGQTM